MKILIAAILALVLSGCNVVYVKVDGTNNTTTTTITDGGTDLNAVPAQQ